MKTYQKGFSVVEIILVGLIVVGLLGTLGWVYLSKMQEKDDNANSSKQETKQTDQGPCKDTSNTAKNGTFCSTDVGISVQVPDAFKGKIEKIENYAVYTQATITEEPRAFGTSEVTYEATLKGDNDQYSLTIAKEPLRTFRVKSLRPAMFNKDTKQLLYQDGTEAESVTINGVKFYMYGTGDAGVITNIYLAVINSKLVVISLDIRQALGDPATRNYILDSNALLNQFKDRIKSLKVV